MLRGTPSRALNRSLLYLKGHLANYPTKRFFWQLREPREGKIRGVLLPRLPACLPACLPVCGHLPGDGSLSYCSWLVKHKRSLCTWDGRGETPPSAACPAIKLLVFNNVEDIRQRSSCSPRLKRTHSNWRHVTTRWGTFGDHSSGRNLLPTCWSDYLIERSHSLQEVRNLICFEWSLRSPREIRHRV